MKNLKKILSLALTAVLALTISAPAFAASGGLEDMPAGTYTYVSKTPAAEADSGVGQIQFIWSEGKIAWAFGSSGSAKTGSAVLVGDELEFFKGLYYSDLPVTDWVGGGLKDTEGYAGEVAGNLDITITENGKISTLNVKSATTRVVANVTKAITDSTLTIIGITRGQPNLLQSCITLIGSTNGLYLTRQGDIILDGLSIGSDKDGVGLKADKIGGDTFIVGTVIVDGTIEWLNKMGVILPLNDQPGTLMTTGRDITMCGGSNIGRVGRNLTISTGEDLGGDIIIGAVVSTDSTRGGITPNADTSADGVTINTSGNIIAGLGDVIIGTNTEKIVIVDLIGNIQGANVTIKPTNSGTATNVTGSIGNITAAESIDIEVGTVNVQSSGGNLNTSSGWSSWQSSGSGLVIGTMTAQNGDVSLKASAVNGSVGDATAKGTVSVSYESSKIDAVPTAATVIVNGTAVSFDAFNIGGNNYFKLRDLAYTLDGTQKQFEILWSDDKDEIALTSGSAYTAAGNEMASKGSEGKTAVSSSISIYLDDNRVYFAAYSIDGNTYLKLRDIGEALDFKVSWDSETSTIIIDTAKGYTAD